MMYSEQPKKDRIRRELEQQIKQYLQQGGKIDVHKPGESAQVDMTNDWKEGFSFNGNEGFSRKKPYKKVKR